MGMSQFKQLTDWAISMVQEGNVDYALSELNNKINQGNSDAYGVLGAFYIYGVGVDIDVNRGLDLLQQSINMGNGDAAYEMAQLYHGQDNILTRNEYKEREYLEIGANLGNGQCCVPLSYSYMNGEGVPKDDYKAYRYAKTASEQGIPDGMMNYAICLAEGIGTSPNPFEAVRWFKEFLNYEPENEFAMLEITQCLADPYEMYGIVPSHDMLQEAYYYCCKAVEKGNVEAHLICGWFYEMGKVVPQDYETAHRFIQIAADNGHEFAKEHLKVYMKNIYGQYYIPN